MLTKRSYLVSFSILQLLFLCTVLTTVLTPAPVRADESGSDRALIKIREHQVEPMNLSVSPGTTVLWQNEAGHAVTVKFTSHGVTTTCKEPLGFGGDFNGIRESSRLSGGEVASLCFLEPKQYRYRVESTDSGEGLMEGTINVASFGTR